MPKSSKRIRRLVHMRQRVGFGTLAQVMHSLDPRGWHIATTILDRILHHARVFSIKGNSYRLRERLLQTAPTSPDGLSPFRKAVSEGR
jgi:IstB-like ATP binding protein